MHAVGDNAGGGFFREKPPGRQSVSVLINGVNNVCAQWSVELKIGAFFGVVLNFAVQSCSSFGCKTFLNWYL